MNKTLSYTTEAEAQAVADSIHQRMIDQIPIYAASVAAGQTLRWAIPTQDRDEDGEPIPGSPWRVAVDSVCWPVLTAQEQVEAG